MSLHLKLPGDLSLDEAHEIAEEVERAIVAARARGRRPCRRTSSRSRRRRQGRACRRRGRRRAETVARIVRDETGEEPEDLRFVHTDDGLVAYLTLRLGGGTLSPTRTPRRAGSRS